MDVQISARQAWSGGGGDERPEKKARVGGIYVGALYNPTEDIVVGEEEVEDVHMDSGDEENKPLSAEEIKEGDEEEFNKMDKYETYVQHGCGGGNQMDLYDAGIAAESSNVVIHGQMFLQWLQALRPPASSTSLE